jgi:hypothetical protein
MTHVRRPYRAVAMVLAAATLIGVGCSSDSEDAKVKTVVTGFLADTADGKGTDACAALTGDAVRYVSTVGVVGQSSASCPDAVKTLSGLFSSDEKKALKSATVKRVSVSGDRATIAHEDIEIKYQGESHIFPRPTNAPVSLMKTDAGWKIESLG